MPRQNVTFHRLVEGASRQFCVFALPVLLCPLKRWKRWNLIGQSKDLECAEFWMKALCRTFLNCSLLGVRKRCRDLYVRKAKMYWKVCYFKQKCTLRVEDSWSPIFLLDQEKWVRTFPCEVLNNHALGWTSKVVTPLCTSVLFLYPRPCSNISRD